MTSFDARYREVQSNIGAGRVVVIVHRKFWSRAETKRRAEDETKYAEKGIPAESPHGWLIWAIQ